MDDGIPDLARYFFPDLGDFSTAGELWWQKVLREPCTWDATCSVITAYQEPVPRLGCAPAGGLGPGGPRAAGQGCGELQNGPLQCWWGRGWRPRGVTQGNGSGQGQAGLAVPGCAMAGLWHSLGQSGVDLLSNMSSFPFRRESFGVSPNAHRYLQIYKALPKAAIDIPLQKINSFLN